MWWKTKIWSWGIYTTRIHWTGTPQDRDEVNKLHPENNEDLRNVILQFVLKCIFFETQSKIGGWLKQEEPRKKIYLKHNLGQKSYYLLSIYKLPLSCHHLLSCPVSGRHISPSLSLFHGNVFILTSAVHFLSWQQKLLFEWIYILNRLIDERLRVYESMKRKLI